MNKKLVAASMAALALGSGLVGAGLHDVLEQPEKEYIEVNNTEVITVVEEVVKEVPVNVTVEKVIEVEDEALLTALCDRLVYDDLAECREEVQAEDSALKIAIEKIKEEFADEDFLEELEDDNIIEDKDEVSVVRIYDDYEDIEVTESDFDDEEYEFEIRVKLDDDEAEEKVYVIATVEVQDGEAEIIDVELE